MHPCSGFSYVHARRGEGDNGWGWACIFPFAFWNERASEGWSQIRSFLDHDANTIEMR